MLRKLAEVAESCRLEANSRPSASARRPIPFTRAGENIITPRQRETARLLSPGSEWSMRVDLGRQLQFPREIAQTSLRPDLVMWSEPSKTSLSCGRRVLRLPTNGSMPNMQTWRRSAGRLAGKPPHAPSKWGAGALSGLQPSAYSVTWDAR